MVDVVDPTAEAAVDVVVRWADMDAFGHVNNAVYLNYVEEARDRVVTSLFGAAAFDFVLAHVAIDYRHQVTQDDGHVRVECRLTGWGRSSVRTSEVVRLPDGTLAAETESVLVARDPDTGSSRPLTDDELARLEAAAP